jgi:lysophospholipase L1-like esterase
MWSPERSAFSLAPTLGWLLLSLVAGMFVLDGSLSALTGRLTAPRQAGPVAGGATGALGVITAAAAAPGESEGQSDGEAAGEGDREPAGGGDGGVAGPSAAALAEGPAADLPTGGATAAAANPLTDVCVEGEPAQCKRHSLDSFRAALAKGRKGELGRALRLSMFGDSVVATDEIPARLRQRVGADLGDGGPGFVFVAPPHRFCDHQAITRTDSGSWLSYAVSMAGVRDRWYGYGGSTAQTQDGSVVIRVKGEPVTRVTMQYLAQPRGGQVELSGDDPKATLATIDSHGEGSAAMLSTTTITAGARRIGVRTHGLVRFFGLVLERDSGAVVDNLGIVSVTAKNFTRNDATHWRDQIQARGPDLVMLLMGANEATWLQGSADQMRDYRAHFTELLEPIRKANVACLVISPLDQVEVTEDAIRSRKLSSRLVEAQRAAAADAGCAFFDTLAWMGGTGSAVRWHRRGWLSGDYVHLTKKGSEKLGDELYRALFSTSTTASGGS